MKLIRLVEADDGPGIRAFYFNGRREIELDFVTFTEVALMRLTDERFRRRARPPGKMVEEAFGDPVRLRGEDGRILYG